jgi:nucleotide-binding universal stress UspA family protein
MKNLSIQNILVPVDFSEMSIDAIGTAKRLARRFGATIHLAHVHHFDYTTAFSPPAPPFAAFPLTSYQQDTEETVAKQLNALAREKSVSPVICHILDGAAAFDEICRLARKIPADLIVMPTHGRTGLKHALLGSTAERIVQHSPCPIFVTRANALQSKNGSAFTIRTILVPVDFSGCSRQGLEYAIAVAQEFTAKIILLHATYLGYIYSVEGTALYDVPGLQKAARKRAEGHMRDLVRSANLKRLKVQTVYTEGSPALDVCAFAKDHDIDLIITSTHGLTGLRHVMIGSVAEKVVRHAPCSVLVVPSHPHLRAANLPKSVRAKARRPASAGKNERENADKSIVSSQSMHSPKGGRQKSSAKRIRTDDTGVTYAGP